MKKSEIYRYAQMAVVSDSAIGANTKLEVIRELQSREELEKFIEDKDDSDVCCG